MLAARAALVAVARVLVVALAWVPPPCPRGPGAPLRASGSPLGGARSAVLVVALSGGAPPGRGGLTCPPPPLGWRNSLAMVLAAAGVLYVVLALILDTRCCGSFSPCPLAPCPPLGGGGKRGITGRKIVTKETQEGCLSFLIISFSELFKCRKTCFRLAKRLFCQTEAPGGF